MQTVFSLNEAHPPPSLPLSQTEEPHNKKNPPSSPLLLLYLLGGVCNAPMGMQKLKITHKFELHENLDDKV